MPRALDVETFIPPCVSLVLDPDWLDCPAHHKIQLHRLLAWLNFPYFPSVFPEACTGLIMWQVLG
jgi:hypothetical protein